MHRVDIGSAARYASLDPTNQDRRICKEKRTPYMEFSSTTRSCATIGIVRAVGVAPVALESPTNTMHVSRKTSRRPIFVVNLSHQCTKSVQGLAGTPANGRNGPLTALCIIKASAQSA